MTKKLTGPREIQKFSIFSQRIMHPGLLQVILHVWHEDSSLTLHHDRAKS